MAGLSHMGIGFAAKRFAPKVPVGLLILATEAIDILWIIFFLLKIESWDAPPVWSHGLFMALVWSSAGALIAAAVSHNARTTLVIGLLVFSHWVLDFVTHPMGAIFGGNPLPPDMPLFFQGSPLVGLGLYNHSYAFSVIFDLGLTLVGIMIYILYRAKTHQEKNTAARLP